MTDSAQKTSDIGSHAMILAAGLGLRMRPLTLTTPKPLIKVAGRALIDYGLEKLQQAGVTDITVNAHYLAEQIVEWAARQHPPLRVSDESHAVLDTGGGIALALNHLGHKPFFVLNSDSFWLEGAVPALERLRQRWRNDTMDCLLLLCPVARTTGYDGTGDFMPDAQGRLHRHKGQGAMAYIGGYLVHPRLFANAPQGAFSMNLLWNQAIEQGRLFGVEHEGHWLHVGTPDAIALAEARLQRSAA